MKLKIILAIFTTLLITIVVVIIVLNNKPNNINRDNVVSPNNYISQPIVYNKILYRFKNYPIQFKYSGDFILNDTFTDASLKSGDIVILSKDGGTLRIRANLPGIGMENEEIEVSEKNFEWNGKIIPKFKFHSKIENTDSFVFHIPYPDSATRGYGVFITYEFKDGKIDEELNLQFDEIVKSLEITDITLDES